MKNGEFKQRFFGGLIHDCYEFQDSNTDFLRFGTSMSRRIKRRLEDKILLFMRRSGFIFIRSILQLEKRSERLMYVLANIDGLQRFYHLLGDDYSKKLLIELLKFRILGARHVKLPLNSEDYWDKRASVDINFLKERRTIRTWNNWYLNRYKLQGVNGPVELHTHPLGILNTFLLEQYAYKKGHRIIQVQPEDVIIDGGVLGRHHALLCRQNWSTRESLLLRICAG